MATRWRQTPDGVRRVSDGPDRAASAAGAVLAIAGTAFALLITGAMLLPGDGGIDAPAGAVGASPTATAVVTGNGPIASPGAMPSPAAVASPRVPPSVPPVTPDPTTAAGAASPAPSARPTGEPLQVVFRSPAPVTQDGREIGRVTVQAVLQAKKTAAVGEGQRLMVAEVRFDAQRSRLPYDELHFRLEDDNGERYEPIAEGAPEPLGAGAVAPSAKRTGQVAFVVPKDRKAVAVVLTDAGGADLVVFSRPQAAR